MKKTLLALCAGVALCASAETFEKGTAVVYNIGPDFHYFDNNPKLAVENANWPDAIMLQGCGFGTADTPAFGTAAVWFNNDDCKPTTVEAADELCPVVADPWNEGAYALKMDAPTWWGFGNFNFAMPNANELCRVRVIFKCDTKDLASYDNANGILFRLTNGALAGAEEGLVNYKEEIPSIWSEPGYRVIDLYYTFPSDQTYLAITFMPGGFSCGGNKPAFYLEEVSVVPTKLLAGDTHVDGDAVGAVVETRPELTVVDGINNASIQEINAAAEAGNAIYDMQGRRVANATRGLYIVNGVKTLVK